MQYIDDTKLDHYYTQVARRSDRKPYRCADNQPLQDLLTGLINFSRAPHKVCPSLPLSLCRLFTLLPVSRCRTHVWSCRAKPPDATWTWNTH